MTRDQVSEMRTLAALVDRWARKAMSGNGRQNPPLTDIRRLAALAEMTGAEIEVAQQGGAP